MEYMAEQIQVYHRLYLSFLSGTLLCLGISGILFVWLDIWSVIGFFTGRQKKSGKQEMHKPVQSKRACGGINRKNQFSFRMERKVMLIHTNERI